MILKQSKLFKSKKIIIFILYYTSGYCFAHKNLQMNYIKDQKFIIFFYVKLENYQYFQFINICNLKEQTKKIKLCYQQKLFCNLNTWVKITKFIRIAT